MTRPPRRPSMTIVDFFAGMHSLIFFKNAIAAQVATGLQGGVVGSMHLARARATPSPVVAVQPRSRVFIAWWRIITCTSQLNHVSV